jgi:drug/metabolite transporter (DMT)-like permease
MLLGLSGVALFCLFQNVGLGFSSAANTALINGGIPLMTAALAALALHEQLGRRQCAGLAISLAGVTCIVLAGDGASFRAALATNLLPLASALSFAVYAVIGRNVFGAGNALAVVTGSTRYGLGFLLPAAWVELAVLGMPEFSLPDAMLLIFLGVGCSGLAFILYGYGLAHVGAAQGAVFGNLKPLAGVALAVCLLGEPLAAGQLVGGGLILAGVVLARPLTKQMPRRFAYHRPARRTPRAIKGASLVPITPGPIPFSPRVSVERRRIT